MTIIKEISDFLKLIFDLKEKRSKKKHWEKLDKNQVPNWIERASHKFHKKHPVRNHDIRKDFNGKNYIYRVYYIKSAHGRVIEEYYKKKINI